MMSEFLNFISKGLDTATSTQGKLCISALTYGMVEPACSTPTKHSFCVRVSLGPLFAQALQRAGWARQTD